jgi:hypothetical protein
MVTRAERPAFPHRHNEDGTYDSFCVVCFSIVASSKKESDLKRHEAVHVCNQLHIYQVRQSSFPRSSPLRAK